MDILQTIGLTGSVEAMALSPGGERLAVVVGRGDGATADFSVPRQDQRVFLFRLTGDGLTPKTDFALPPDPERFGKENARFDIDQTRLVFRDDQTLFVARHQSSTAPDRGPSVEGDEAELLLVDVATQTVQERYVKTSEWYMMGVELMPSDYVLLGLQYNVVCLDARTLTEVCQVRPMDEDGILTEADTVEESICPDGFVCDPQTGRVSLLGGNFESAILLTYRFRPDIRKFRRVSRRAPFEPFVPSSLRLLPDGSLLVTLQIMERRMSLQGRPITVYSDNLAEARALYAAGAVPPPPETAIIGQVRTVGQETRRPVDIYGDFVRDGLGRRMQLQEADGTVLHYGYTTYSEDNYMPAPALLDDRVLFLTTPDGILQRVDLIASSCETLHDFHGPINALRYSPAHRVLLAGGTNGVLTVLRP